MVVHSDMLEQARKLHQTGKLADAERVYRQVLQANGHDAEVWYLLGDTVQGQGRLAEAAERFRQALELRPNHMAARSSLGVTLAGMRKLPEAVAELRQAVRLRPDFTQGHHNLGVALAELGNFEEAVACLRQALTLQPDYAEACYNLGNVLISQGNVKRPWRNSIVPWSFVPHMEKFTTTWDWRSLSCAGRRKRPPTCNRESACVRSPSRTTTWG